MIKKSEIGELIIRCKENDKKAQSLIYRSYYDRYYTLCLRYLGDQELAKEVVNEMFYKVFNQITKLREVNLFEGWMKKICINTCLNEIKKKKLFKMEKLDEVKMQEIPFNLNDGDLNLSLEDLMDMVKSLPTRMRTIFNLYVIDGFNHQEIAEQLSISSGTSKFHLHQAKLQLQGTILGYSNTQI